jgi:tRNA U34 5-carboxymethylaminomethyl modifying enzyme MnmG/GidA
MKIEISREILKDIEKASKEMDLNEKELVERAIKFYLYIIREHISLKEELEAWEKASIKDLIDFEMRI